MIHQSNTVTAPPVARISGHRTSDLLGQGYAIQVTLEDTEGIATAILYVSHHQGNFTTYSPVRKDALCLPKNEAVRALGYLRNLVPLVYKGIPHIALQLIPAGRVK